MDTHIHRHDLAATARLRFRCHRPTPFRRDHCDLALPLHPLRGGRVWLSDSVSFGIAGSPLTDAIARHPDRHEHIPSDRCREHAANIAATLQAIRDAAEDLRG